MTKKHTTLTFDLAKQIQANPELISQYNFRSVLTQKRYERDLAKLAKKNISPRNHILSQIGVDKYAQVIITDSDYPYKVEKGYSHYIVWCTDGLTPNDQKMYGHEFAHDYIETFLTSCFGENNFVFWQNPAKNRSVVGLTHYHVIAKNEPLLKPKFDFLNILLVAGRIACIIIVLSMIFQIIF